jgi:hypothetical protein
MNTLSPAMLSAAVLLLSGMSRMPNIIVESHPLDDLDLDRRIDTEGEYRSYRPKGKRLTKRHERSQRIDDPKPERKEKSSSLRKMLKAKGRK